MWRKRHERRELLGGMLQSYHRMAALSFVSVEYLQGTGSNAIFNGLRQTWKRDHVRELADTLTTAESESYSSNPYLVGNLERLLREVARMSTQGGFSTLPCGMALGTLPTGQVNGFTIRTSHGGVIVAINEVLPAFLVRITSS